MVCGINYCYLQNEGGRQTPSKEMNFVPSTMPQPGAPGCEELTPTVPYFDLPAALIAPLVKVGNQCI